MANADIIKRSKLFDDSPVRSPRNTSRRCETMFDKMKEDEKVKQKTEKELERFEDSLVVASQEIDTEEVKVQEENDLDVIVMNTEPAKRRVIPPVPGRRPPIHSKKTAKPNGEIFILLNILRIRTTLLFTASNICISLLKSFTCLLVSTKNLTLPSVTDNIYIIVGILTVLEWNQKNVYMYGR